MMVVTERRHGGASARTLLCTLVGLTALLGSALWPTSAGADESAPANEVKLPAWVVQVNNAYTVNGTAVCASKTILMMSVPSDIVRYQASVDQPGVEDFTFGGPPFTNPITGFGLPYTVPEGEAGWFLGGQSGSGECGDMLEHYLPPKAVGYTAECPEEEGASDGLQSQVRAAKVCPLTVTIAPVDSQRAGLAYYNSDPTFIDEAANKCVSGCTDLQVTVTDPGKHNAPVPGATVHVAIGDYSNAPPGFTYPSGTEPQPPYVCSGNDCGSVVSGLTTNSKGQVLVRYWGPGLLGNESADIKASATAPAGSCGCSERAGSGVRTITITPHLIFQSTGTITAQQVDGLVEWVSHPLKPLASKGLEEMYGRLIEELVEEEEKAKTYVAIGEEAGSVMEVVEVVEAFFEQQGILAEFLDDLHLSGTGLGDPPREHSVPMGPDNSFIADVAGDGYPPLHLGEKGYMWTLAEELAKLEEDKSPNFGPQTLQVQVYELSYCDSGSKPQDNCTDYLGPDATGIEPYLEFHISASSGSDITYSSSFIIKYNAYAWMVTQAAMGGLHG